MSLYHLLEDGHPTDEVWAVDHRQPIYLPFTRRITSTKSWPPYVKALSLALQLAEGDKIQLKTVFFSLCFLCFFFSLVQSIYICDQFLPLDFLAIVLILTLAHSHYITLFLYPDIFYFLFVTNIFAFIGVVWWKIFVFLTRKKKISRFIRLVILFNLPDRIGKSDEELITGGLYSVGFEFSMILARTRIKL